ncbi:hypothetical protein AB205_0121370 [Aquarana catesbeiana]|uniref:Uncharacterized protein n=1 Tax=Aquarana catesbeiana TaxID=8400 RepID=A0A2G9P655_AQUCT|nr:hypothetical protein AB205_0121370 [Aquarana catesbeiana]
MFDQRIYNLTTQFLGRAHVEDTETRHPKYTAAVLCDKGPMMVKCNTLLYKGAVFNIHLPTPMFFSKNMGGFSKPKMAHDTQQMFDLYSENVLHCQTFSSV